MDVSTNWPLVGTCTLFVNLIGWRLFGFKRTNWVCVSERGPNFVGYLQSNFLAFLFVEMKSYMTNFDA